MKTTTIFCLTLNPVHEECIKQLSYTPVGLGSEKFSNNFFKDTSGLNISSKNPYYGEYTFHYWIWKNYLNNIKSEWTGFCQYRKFFLKKDSKEENFSFNKLKEFVITNVEDDYNFDCILGKKFSVTHYKFSKIIKNHLTTFLSKPSLFYKKSERNLKLHFDIFHGKNNLDKAIELLDKNERSDFGEYMIKNTSFHPHNMFICKTKILNRYYEIIFPWLQRCEDIFGFNRKEYGSKRIYGFLAERFLSYWFTKYYKIKEMPIIVKDLSDYKNL